MENNLPPVVASVWGSVAHVSFDVVVILLLFLGLTAFSFYFGKSKSIALLISSYIALFIFPSFPFLKGDTAAASVSLGLFVALWFIIFFLIKRVVSTEFPYSLLKKLLESALLALSLLCVIFVSAYHFLPIDTIYHFSNLIAPLFSPEKYIFYWLSIPIIVVFFVARR